MKNKYMVPGITAVVALVVGFGGGYFVPHGSATPARASFGGGSAAFAARGGGTATFAAGGGATIGTILQVGNGSITVQLPNSTSTSADTGTKLVLVGDSTQVDEMESVPVSSLSVGQSVTVTGSANSDGSVTATSIQVLPAGARRGAAPSGQ